MRDQVPGERRLVTDRQLADALLLTYALRNADRHANNLAQLSTSRADVHRSPVPDRVDAVAAVHKMERLVEDFSNAALCCTALSSCGSLLA